MFFRHSNFNVAKPPWGGLHGVSWLVTVNSCRLRSLEGRSQAVPGGLGWGDENLKVAVCRMVALWATVATRRGVWGARVEAKLFAL